MMRQSSVYYHDRDLHAAFSEFSSFDCKSENERGAVFSVWDMERHRRVALKLTRDTGSPEVATRFSQEYDILLTSHHERLVTVYRYGRRMLSMSNGSTLHHYFYTMELCDSDMAREAPQMDLAGRLRAISQFLEGLAFLHTRHIAHRDIKPHNLLVKKGAEQLIKIGDFGIAKTSPGAGITHDGFRPFTPGYAGPEFLGKGPSGPEGWQRNDQYAAGVTIYQILTRALEWPLDEHGLWRPLIIPERRSRRGAPEQLPEVEAVLRLMLAPVPGDRYESISRCQLALKRALAPYGL